MKFGIMGAFIMTFGLPAIAMTQKQAPQKLGLLKDSITLKLAHHATLTPIPFVLNLDAVDPMTQRPYHETLCCGHGVLIGLVKNMCQVTHVYDGPSLIDTLRRTEPAKKNTLIIHYFLAPSCEHEFQYVGDQHSLPTVITTYANALHDHAWQRARAKKSSPLRISAPARELGLAQYGIACFFEEQDKHDLAITWYEKAADNGCEGALLALKENQEHSQSDAE